MALSVTSPATGAQNAVMAQHDDCPCSKETCYTRDLIEVCKEKDHYHNSHHHYDTISALRDVDMI